MVKMLFFIGMTFLVSCSSDSYLREPDETAVNVSQNGEPFRLSQDEAVTKACETLGKKQSRSEGAVSVEYVLRSETHKGTRSASAVNDTVAYIINYPDNGGFAIVAADKRVSRVLAYADHGYFDKEIPTVKETFLSNIGDYVDEQCSGTRSSVDPGIQDPPKPQTYYTIPTIIEINLSQESPWDRYVKKEYPLSPVGCVPVAVTNILSHCADSLSFEGKDYYFGPIVRGIKAGPPSISYPKSITGPGFSSDPIIGGFTMNYYTAIDKMACLMYDIGKPGNLNVEYRPYISGARITDAYVLIRRLGYETTSIHRGTMSALFSLVKENNLIFVGGVTGSGNEAMGHAWVIDGCQYPDIGGTCENYLEEVYFWCNWGWGGTSNGYFVGDVYTTKNGVFRLSECFGVKIKSTFTAK